MYPLFIRNFLSNFFKISLRGKTETFYYFFLELAKRNSNDKDFVKKATLDTLLQIFSSITAAQPCVVQILNNILRDVHNFTSILKQNIIFKLYESRQLEGCSTNCPYCLSMQHDVMSLINSFGCNGGSGYGIGELTHLLLKGEKQMQIQAAIMTLYLIKGSKPLYILLFLHNALDIVFNIIFNDANNDYAYYASNGISVMAHNLNIKMHNDLNEDLSIMEKSTYFDDGCQDGSDCTDVVTFIAKNDEEIQFNRQILIESSDFFKTMFESDFREAQENTVQLKNISALGLKYFLRLIIETKDNDIETVCVSHNMVSALEAYGLSKVYLLTRIEIVLLYVIKSTISYLNVLDVFEWSLKNYDNELLSTSISFYLASENLTGKEKTIMLNKAYNSSFKEQWVQRMKDTISLKCNFGE